MPQVKAIAADLKDLPVIVLGMNTDADPRNAQFVVEQLGLKYDVLRVDPRLPELAKFGVEAFPTVVIIDQRGIVRGIHAGYSPDLKKSIELDVRRLLKTAR